MALQIGEVGVTVKLHSPVDMISTTPPPPTPSPPPLPQHNVTDIPSLKSESHDSNSGKGGGADLK